MAAVVLLFGRLKDAFRAAEIERPSGVATAADLRARLIERYTEFEALLASRSVRIIVNHVLIADEAATPIASGDEVALAPPLSGG